MLTQYFGWIGSVYPSTAEHHAQSRLQLKTHNPLNNKHGSSRGRQYLKPSLDTRRLRVPVYVSYRKQATERVKCWHTYVQFRVITALKMRLWVLNDNRTVYNVTVLNLQTSVGENKQNIEARIFVNALLY